MTTDTIKHLGAEFHRAADSLADTLARLDNARLERLTFLRRCSKDSTARLATLREEVRALPEQIAKWDAEAARLESQTAEDLLRQALEPGRAEKPTEERGPVFGPEDHERCHYCKGLFLKPVEHHHTEEECAFLTSQAELGAVVLHPQPPGEVIEAPLTQPKPEPYRAGLPPERLRKVWAEWEDETGIVQLRKNGDGWEYRYAHWLNEQEWGDVYSDIWGSANIRPHGATWSRVEAMADEAEKPTLLDLTKLPPGTVCEATNFFPIYNSGKMMHTTDRFRTQRVASGELPVLAVVGEDLWWFPALVPARVVKEGGEQ